MYAKSMKIIAGFLSSLLVPLLLSASLSLVVRKTIMDSGYIGHKIETTQVTTDLSRVLPGLIVKQAGPGVDAKQVQAVVQTVLTPGAIQSKVTDGLSQLNSYLANNGAVPELDLRDLAIQARKSGLDIPDELTTKPLVLPADTGSQLKRIYSLSNQIDMISLVATGVLFLLLFLICVRLKNYKFLVSLFLTNGAFQLVLFVAARYAPMLLLQHMPAVDPAAQELVVIGQKLGFSILGDIASWFGWLAVAFFAIGFVILGLSFVSATRHKHLAKPA